MGERVRLRGVVQGVGMRPTVARLARARGLRGWVRNDGEGVEILSDASLLTELLAALPPLARVEAVEVEAAEVDLPDFRIVESAPTRVRTELAPDAAMCPDCRAEVDDPRERRFDHPFTTCTACGPRWSLARALPFDRARTSMAGFPTCPDCAREYADPEDRRFHAQTLACPACGPRLDGELDAAAALLRGGGILALEGLGGWQLLCDATDEAAVQRLRRRKQRPDKPLAVMLLPEQLDAFAEAGAEQRALLASPAAPILLLPARGLAPSVAPGLRETGLFFPTTPLHHRLLRRVGRPVVCTSGNRSAEPQDIGDGAALAGIADLRLGHDRPILRRVDDSVARWMDGAPRLLRRARGYAPAPLRVPGRGRVLALGGHMKAAICLLDGERAVLSPHLGDLDDLATLEAFEATVAGMLELYDFVPERIAVDLHPRYASTVAGRELARRRGLPVVAVQHHHAHVAAVMAEHRVEGPVLGLVLDGAGAGDDGQVWGAELLAADYAGYRRLWHLPTIPLLGGDRAAREPWRALWAHLREFTAVEPPEPPFPRASVEALRARSVRASSMGRLFDAVAAALGFGAASFEGQAAMWLEAQVDPAELQPAWPLELPAMWAGILDGCARGEPVGRLAARFHASLADGLVARVGAQPGSEPVVLAGGCFQNRVLFERVSEGLRRCGRVLLQPRELPCNDGAICLGQALIADRRPEARWLGLGP